MKPVRSPFKKYNLPHFALIYSKIVLVKFCNSIILQNKRLLNTFSVKNNRFSAILMFYDYCIIRQKARRIPKKAKLMREKRPKKERVLPL